MRPALFACFLVLGCLKSTPFQAEPSETDVTAQQLQKLRSRPEPRGAWTFLAFGDTHDDYDNLARSVDLMNGSDARLALIAGDMVDRGTLQEFEWSGELYQRLNMPFFTAIGNHDELSGGTHVYERMYGPREYSFTYGGLKFVAFDSNTLENPAAPNRDWLTAQVEDHGDDKVVLLMHQPILSPSDLDGGTNREFYDQLLASGNVALVIHGHDDVFFLKLAHGVPVMQCGTYETQFLHTLVTFEQDRFRFRVCHFDECEERLPEPESAETAEP
jgi:predicted phosphodiesterase